MTLGKLAHQGGSLLHVFVGVCPQLEEEVDELRLGVEVRQNFVELETEVHHQVHPHSCKLGDVVRRLGPKLIRNPPDVPRQWPASSFVRRIHHLQIHLDECFGRLCFLGEDVRDDLCIGKFVIDLLSASTLFLPQVP